MLLNEKDSIIKHYVYLARLKVKHLNEKVTQSGDDQKKTNTNFVAQMCYTNHYVLYIILLMINIGNISGVDGA